MTQYSDQVEKRRKETLDEQMDNSITCYYFQKHEKNKDIEDYRQLDYASGRRVITDISKGGEPKTTQNKPMRRHLFINSFGRYFRND